jgi:bacterioferritin (cytochrome b1)
MRKFNNTDKLTRDIYHQGTIDLLSRIHNSDEGHINWAEIQRALIDQMGMEDYLVSQTESPLN